MEYGCWNLLRNRCYNPKPSPSPSASPTTTTATPTPIIVQMQTGSLKHSQLYKAF